MDTATPPLVITERAIQHSTGATLTTTVPGAVDTELDAYHALMDSVANLAHAHQLTPPEAISWLRRILVNVETDLARVDADPIVRDSDDYGCDLCCRPEGCPMCIPWSDTPEGRAYGALPPSCDPISPF